jgi:hypothetical protein
MATTAPDGGDLLLWTVSGAVSPQNTIKAKLRRPGSDTWVRVPSPVVNKPYAGSASVAPTLGGDFWAAFEWYDAAGGSEIYVARLDTGTRRWTKPKRVFHDADYGHTIPALAVSDDGTLFAAATAKPNEFSSPPRYRAEVATKRPGHPWKTKFVSPAAGFAVVREVVANPKGQAAAAFIQGYDLSAMTVRAATRDAGARTKWKVTTLSPAGDSQRAYTAIGADGTAAVEWTSPSNGAVTVRMATNRIGAGAPWLFADAVTGGGGSNNATHPVVAPDGTATALWETFINPNSVLYARQLDDGVWTAPATPFSQAGMRGVLSSANLRPGGTVGVVYQQFSAGPSNEGLRFRVLDHAAPGAELVLTDAGDGSANSVWFGVDAALRNHLVWTRGDYPDTDFATMGDPAGRPSAMRSPRSGVELTAATVQGTMRVGRRATCRTGYWVEATGVGYRWFRDGTRIRHQSGRKYLLASADKGHKVSCRAKATSDVGPHTLTSPGRKVH